MTKLSLELPPELYHRLREEATRQGKSPQAVAQEWLAERLALVDEVLNGGRKQVRAVLRAAGLLTELGPTLLAKADPTVRLEEVQEALHRAEGKPLSEIILEQRSLRECT